MLNANVAELEEELVKKREQIKSLEDELKNHREEMEALRVQH